MEALGCSNPYRLVWQSKASHHLHGYHEMITSHLSWWVLVITFLCGTSHGFKLSLKSWSVLQLSSLKAIKARDMKVLEMRLLFTEQHASHLLVPTIDMLLHVHRLACLLGYVLKQWYDMIWCITWDRVVSHIITWYHKIIRYQTTSHGITWDHMRSHDITWYTRSHEITWYHMVHKITWDHMRSHGANWWHAVVCRLAHCHG